MQNLSGSRHLMLRRFLCLCLALLAVFFLNPADAVHADQYSDHRLDALTDPASFPAYPNEHPPEGRLTFFAPILTPSTLETPAPAYAGILPRLTSSTLLRGKACPDPCLPRPPPL